MTSLISNALKNLVNALKSASLKLIFWSIRVYSL